MSRAVMRSENVLDVATRVELAARRIDAVSRAATLSFAIEIGRIVVETLYFGDVDEMRRRGRKEQSLRELAGHPSLSISASTLYRSIALFEMCSRLGCADRLNHLGVSHLRAILSAPEEAQESLVRRADVEQWSVSQVEGVVANLAQQKEKKGGRPRSPEYVKSIRRMGQLIDPAALDGLDEAGCLDPREAQELLSVVEKIRERISLIEHLLVRPSRGKMGLTGLSAVPGS